MSSKLLQPLGTRSSAHTKLLARLQAAHWICQGTLVCRPLRRKVAGCWVNKGPYYLWTGKQRGKTVSHALSKAQYQVAKEAIAANRQVLQALNKLQNTTLEKILKTIPGVHKRK